MTSYDKNLIHEFPGQLFAAHDTDCPSGYAREAYDRTECGVSTSFILADGSRIHSSDLDPTQDTGVWATRHIVGIQHGTIVEGSDAEFDADPLFFPFSDEELAQTWDYLNEKVEEVNAEADAEEEE